MEATKNYRLYFINYKKRDHVEYFVRLNCLEDNSINVEFMERYSSLKELHDEMRKETNSVNFPKYPPKKFFNLDEKFLNQRQSELQHYFNTILGSKEFSQLPSLRRWISGFIKKYNVPNIRMSIEPLIIQDNSNTPVQLQPQVEQPVTKPPQKQTFIRDKGIFINSENMQRCKEIVDKYSKNFIDLGSDNPHYENEDGNNKERVYKNLITNKRVFDSLNSNFFTSIGGNNSNFNNLGLPESKIDKYESYMKSRISNISKMIRSDIPDIYKVDDLTVKIEMIRI
jgi:hypothetical protein